MDLRLFRRRAGENISRAVVDGESSEVTAEKLAGHIPGVSCSVCQWRFQSKCETLLFGRSPLRGVCFLSHVRTRSTILRELSFQELDGTVPRTFADGERTVGHRLPETWIVDCPRICIPYTHKKRRRWTGTVNDPKLRT